MTGIPASSSDAPHFLAMCGLAGILTGPLGIGGGIVTDVDLHWLQASGLISATVNATALCAVFSVVALLFATNIPNPRTLTLVEGPPDSRPVGVAIAGPRDLWAKTRAGGGAPSVLTQALRSLPAHRAVARAVLLSPAVAVPGRMGLALAGRDLPGLQAGGTVYINLPSVIAIALATIVFAPLGVRIAHDPDARRPRAAFAMCPGVSGARMLSGAFP